MALEINISVKSYNIQYERQTIELRSKRLYSYISCSFCDERCLDLHPMATFQGKVITRRMRWTCLIIRHRDAGVRELLFAVASVLCALCTGASAFIACRVVQGVGGAMMVPVGRLVVLRTTAKAELMRAIAVLTWPAAVRK